jgi:Winged helix DNA-binding domain
MAKLRAWWWHRQGLDGRSPSTPAEVLARTGWARSVGGGNPYLSLFARAGTRRADVDAAVRALDIHELPSARGCTYVLPAVHFGLGLQVGRGAPEADLKVLAKLDVPRSEVDALGEAVLSILDGGATLDPAQLKEQLGDRVRNLGEAGRKRGQTTTLPAALGLLQAAGEIRRVPANGRLDQQRYGYVRWSAPSSGLTDDEARTELARLYFDWTGPATLAHFRWFSAFSVAQAKAAVAPLDLVPLDDGYLAPAPLAAEFAAFTPPTKPRYALLAGIDALILLRRDVPALVAESDVDTPVPGEPMRAGGLTDLTDHAIVDRGRLVGLWQYDVAAGEVVTWLFNHAKTGGGRPDKALQEAIERTRTYVRDDLGDARSFSLDSPKSRAPRIAALRGT